MDEAWLFLDNPLFASRIREWLKTLRKKNVAVIFATQSLADISGSSILRPRSSNPVRNASSCPTIGRWNRRPAHFIERFGLNERQVELIATANPKRDYYLQSRLGNRLFQLGLGPLALALCGTSNADDQKALDEILNENGAANFAAHWLRHKGLDWAVQLLTQETSS